MAFARDPYTATGGQTDFTITFPYEDQDDVLVYQNGTLLTLTTDYTFFNSTTIRLNSGATLGDTIIIQRSTSQSSKNVTFTAGTLTSTDLNDATDQLFYMAQEAIDIANTALGLDTDDNWTAQSKRIKNVTDPTSDQDAATKNYVDQAVTGSLGSPISIANGGTAATTAAAARTSLGVQADVITTRGDVVRGSSAAVAERLALGKDGQVVGSDGTDTVYDYPKASIMGDAKDLVVINNVTNPTYQIDIDADEVVVKSSLGGPAKVVSGVNLTVDLTASGANGLDTGMEASATWYYGYVIYNPTSGTTAGLLSTSASSPTLPSGYTHYALVTAVYNDSGSDLRPYKQYGKVVWDADTSGLWAVVTSGSATSITSVDCSAYAPPEAIAGYFTVDGNTLASAGQYTTWLYSNNNANLVTLTARGIAYDATIRPYNTDGYCPFIVSQTVYYANGVGSQSTNIYIRGFVLP